MNFKMSELLSIMVKYADEIEDEKQMDLLNDCVGEARDLIKRWFEKGVEAKTLKVGFLIVKDLVESMSAK